MPSVTPLADGELIVLEGPWPLGETSLACVEDESALDSVKKLARNGSSAFAVEGIAPPANGGAFVIAAHKMLDPVAFRPYAETIHDLLTRFGVRSLARGGKITPLAGSFAPERGVVLEFASPEAAMDFYTSEIYAPWLALRLRTTDPRFAVMARKGKIAASTRQAAQDYLATHPR
jgi:uncharacterized protein (DUF1330 family)